MFAIKLHSINWNYAFMLSDTRLDPDTKNNLIIEAIEMYYKGMKNKRISGENYEGSMKVTNYSCIIGGMIGREYSTEIDVDGIRGKSKLKIIISDQTHVQRNHLN